MSNPDMTWIPSGDGEKRKVRVLTSDGTRYDYQSAHVWREGDWVQIETAVGLDWFFRPRQVFIE